MSRRKQKSKYSTFGVWKELLDMISKYKPLKNQQITQEKL